MKQERKKTHTYSSRPSIVELARKKAYREGVTLSEKIDTWINEYVSARKVKSKVVSDLLNSK